MSYRKVKINDKEYKYVTGKTHTKIVDVGVFKNEDIASYKYEREFCECCKEPTQFEFLRMYVKPSDIVKVINAFIEGKPVKSTKPEGPNYREACRVS